MMYHASNKTKTSNGYYPFNRYFFFQLQWKLKEQQGKKIWTNCKAIPWIYKSKNALQQLVVLQARNSTSTCASKQLPQRCLHYSILPQVQPLAEKSMYDTKIWMVFVC